MSGSGVLPETLMQEFSEFLASQIGLRFPADRWRDLDRGMLSAAPEFGFEDTESCIRWLLSSPLTRDQIELLSGHLAVGETYFFRDRRSFEILRDQILPDLINTRQASQERIRIWSAGCCTGEEPYSLAILLDQMIHNISDWNLTILATDINPGFLRKAKDGIYSRWSFRDAPPGFVQRYFKKMQEDRFELLPRIREMVTFSYLNLAEDAYPSLLSNTNGMDLILCRNVLLYFSQERAAHVAERLYRSLVDGGWLIVGPSELSHTLFSQFTTVDCHGAILYRKDRSVSKRDMAAIPVKAPSCTPPRDPGPASRFVPGIAPYPAAMASLPEEVGYSLPAQPAEPEEGSIQAAAFADALTLFEQGHYDRAEEKLAPGLSQSPVCSGVLTLMARICANQGKLAEALGWCNKAIARDKLNPNIHYLRATILQEQGGHDDAIPSLKRALYIDRGFVLAHVALGHIAARQTKAKEAERHFANALSVLKAYPPGEALPEADGMTAERLQEILENRNPFTARSAGEGRDETKTG